LEKIKSEKVAQNYWPILAQFNWPLTPTPVGVFPPPAPPRCTVSSLPHARGGVSSSCAFR
jgi:hypothetical protein